jgi:hypothetical protein
MKMDLRETGWGGMGWIDLAQDKDPWQALANTVMNLQVPQNVGKFLSSYTTGGFSRRAQLHEVSQSGTHINIQNRNMNMNQALSLD